MVRVESAGQRAERRQDHLGLRDDEAAARDLPALEIEPELGMIVARHFRARIAADRFMAQDDPGDLDLLDQSAAAMIGKAGIVVAHDPSPIETLGQFRQQFAGAFR